MKLDKASPRTPGEFYRQKNSPVRGLRTRTQHEDGLESFEIKFSEKFDPWDLENRVQAELDLPRTKIDLSKGAIPNYGGYIPGLKYRFGESYAALSTQAK